MLLFYYCPVNSSQRTQEQTKSFIIAIKDNRIAGGLENKEDFLYFGGYLKTHLCYFCSILSFLHSPLDHSLAPVGQLQGNGDRVHVITMVDIQFDVGYYLSRVPGHC